MEILNVLAAAVASYAFGSVWYMVLAKPWMAAAGVTESDIKDENGKMKGGPAPFIIAFLCAIVIAGMMRHIFMLAGISGIGKGMISGFGLGLFIVTPWLATHYAFSMRPRALTIIDGGYATVGSAIMGLVLTLF